MFATQATSFTTRSSLHRQKQNCLRKQVEDAASRDLCRHPPQFLVRLNADHQPNPIACLVVNAAGVHRLLERNPLTSIPDLSTCKHLSILYDGALCGASVCMRDCYMLAHTHTSVPLSGCCWCRHLSESLITHIPELKVPQLRRLDIVSAHVHTIAPKAFHGTPELQILYIDPHNTMPPLLHPHFHSHAPLVLQQPRGQPC